MKKLVSWFLALLLTGTLVLFCVSLLGRQVIAPSMNEEGAPVSDSVIRQEQELLEKRLTEVTENYGLPAEPALEAADGETLRDLNVQASRWWSSILMTARPTDGISWDTDELEQELMSAADEKNPNALYLALDGTEAVRKSVLRTVLPMRKEIIEPALQKVRQKVDLPSIIDFFLGIPWAALALCSLLAGLIALLQSRRISGCLKYIGASLGAAALVVITLGALYLSAGIGAMIREASESLMILYRDAISRAAVPALLLLAAMIVGCVLCLVYSQRREETV